MVGLATHFNAFPCLYFIIFWLEAGARRGPVLYFCLLSSFVHSFTHMSDVAVRCSCGKNAGTHCLKEPKLCGNCCWPRCAEDSHGSGRRGTKRGSAGNKSAKDKRRTYRNESWMDASLIVDVVQANPETMGYVRRSGYTIAQLTHKLWYLLQQPVGETLYLLSSSINFHQTLLLARRRAWKSQCPLCQLREALHGRARLLGVRPSVPGALHQVQPLGLVGYSEEMPAQ